MKFRIIFLPLFVFFQVIEHLADSLSPHIVMHQNRHKNLSPCKAQYLEAGVFKDKPSIIKIN